MNNLIMMLSSNLKNTHVPCDKGKILKVKTNVKAGQNPVESLSLN